MGWRLADFLALIKFSHSIFALPFAALAAVLAGLTLAPAITPAIWAYKLGLITLAMVCARAAAMSFNRLADARLDAENPRTRLRHLPRGVLTRPAVAGFTLACAFMFVVAAWLLSPLCLALAPIALVVILGYSYTKRATALSHFVLGAALGLAPVGAWLAIKGTFLTPLGAIAWTPWLLGLAVLLWTAGFDIIYACQDVEFDRARGLHSIPAALGTPAALVVSAVLHALTLALLAGWFLGVVPEVAPPALAGDSVSVLAWIGLGVVAVLLVYEHAIVRPSDLSRVDVAFFTLNGAVSLVFAGTVIAGLLL